MVYQYLTVKDFVMNHVSAFSQAFSSSDDNFYLFCMKLNADAVFILHLKFFLNDTDIMNDTIYFYGYCSRKASLHYGTQISIILL